MNNNKHQTEESIMFELTPYERRHQRALFNPFRDMENFEKNFWGDMAVTDFKTDIKDNGKEYVLEAELPGFKKEDIHVDIEDGYSQICGQGCTYDQYE